jgi:ABC-type nickel/cobalt efflux system permease component RcnA
VPGDVLLLFATTAGVAFAHTLLGPDHYVPFVAMARAGGWSRAKTVRITLLCGLGHVASSALLAMVGVALGFSVAKLEAFDSLRGSLAAWALILFGAVYAAWGLRAALRGKPHTHRHAHPGEPEHVHEHVHAAAHLHLHESSRANGTPAATGLGGWALFTVFLLGPCEPLIPLLLFPAATGSPGRILALVAVFAAVTLATMLGVVLLATAGLGRALAVPGRRFGHAVAGGLVLGCGLLMEFAGL